MDVDKGLGPDDFMMVFFQNCWEAIKGYVFKTFEQFFLKGSVGINMNSTFITLVQNKDHFVMVFGYCFIILVKIVYKIIVEMFSLRLHEVVGGTILGH